MTRLYLDIGRDDGVRPADIVGAIANEANIPGRAIGAIELFERFAFVEVPGNLSERVLRALKRTTIRGRKIAPSIASRDGKGWLKTPSRFHSSGEAWRGRSPSEPPLFPHWKGRGKGRVALPLNPTHLQEEAKSLSEEL